MTIRVVQVGLGPIGVTVARQLEEREGFELVGGVDLDPAMAGRELAEVCGFAEGRGRRVWADLGDALAELAPDAVTLCTGSSLARVAPTVETCLLAGVSVVSTTEELAFPWLAQPELAQRIDQAGRRGGAAVVATGINPGFAMDALPLALTAVCRRVDAVRVYRLQDAGRRRLPFQLKVGAGLTPEEFADQVASGGVRHVGLRESVEMIASAMGWELDEVTDVIQPRIADQPQRSDELEIPAGRVCGVLQVGTGRQGDRVRVRLGFDAWVGAPGSYDEVQIEGEPSLRSRVEGGFPGDLATASLVVNAVPRVLAAPPGLLTVKDMPPAHCWPG